MRERNQLIRIGLPPEVRVKVGPAGDSQEENFSLNDTFVVFRPEEQYLESGYVRLGLIKDGEKGDHPQVCYLPIKDEQETLLQQALEAFEKIVVSSHPWPVDSVRAGIHGLIESAILGARVVGPDFLRIEER
jgi:hypothetical protein